MRPIAPSLALACLALALALSACAGEETATQYPMNETYDETRGGARLLLTYEAGANAFVGTFINTTDAALRNVRVSVRLSNGAELGPTAPVDIAPGESANVSLPATEEPFSTWSAHPESG